MYAYIHRQKQNEKQIAVCPQLVNRANNNSLVKC